MALFMANFEDHFGCFVAYFLLFFSGAVMLNATNIALKKPTDQGPDTYSS